MVGAAIVTTICDDIALTLRWLLLKFAVDVQRPSYITCFHSGVKVRFATELSRHSPIPIAREAVDSVQHTSGTDKHARGCHHNLVAIVTKAHGTVSLSYKIWVDAFFGLSTYVVRGGARGKNT